MIPLVAVAALGRNGAIGRDNRLPWSMPSDLAHFRALTMGKPMIMGRRTFEAIGRVLPGRDSIVVTRARLLPAQDLWPVGSPEDALALAQARARAMGASEIVLAGGATLFSSMMPLVERLCLSIIDMAPEADTFFPTIDPHIWQETGRVVVPRHPKDQAACCFVDYARVR